MPWNHRGFHPPLHPIQKSAIFPQKCNQHINKGEEIHSFICLGVPMSSTKFKSDYLADFGRNFASDTFTLKSALPDIQIVDQICLQCILLQVPFRMMANIPANYDDDFITGHSSGNHPWPTPSTLQCYRSSYILLSVMPSKTTLWRWPPSPKVCMGRDSIHQANPPSHHLCCPLHDPLGMPSLASD